MSVPDRGNHPNRQATFECAECGKTAPIHEHGVDGVCNACFDDRYGPNFDCTHEKADGSGWCGYSAVGKTKKDRRNDLDRHFDEDPEHNGDPDSRYIDEDEASNFHSSFAPSFTQQDEDAFHASKDYDIEEPKRPYGKSE